MFSWRMTLRLKRLSAWLKFSSLDWIGYLQTPLVVIWKYLERIYLGNKPDMGIISLCSQAFIQSWGEERDLFYLDICVAPIDPLHDPVKWYWINYSGTQITQWDFQNKGKSGWTGKSSFVLEVPLPYLRHSIIYSVPCHRIVQSAQSFRKPTISLIININLKIIILTAIYIMHGCN